MRFKEQDAVGDELQERYAMTKRHRIAVFGEVLNRANDELSNRDPSTLPTDKLINLVIKLSDTLKQDETELELHGGVELQSFKLGELTKWKIEQPKTCPKIDHLPLFNTPVILYNKGIKCEVV